MSTLTIFFAWQSVRSGRNLIRRALDRAIERLHADASIEEALRVDHDTDGVPGSPAVTATILKKIDEGDVVLADVTFIGTDLKGRPVPNPNVMLEYGYALARKGDRGVLAVMNTAFGHPRDLPFDIAHRRWPIQFELPDDADEKTRAKISATLSKAFEEHLRMILASRTGATHDDHEEVGMAIANPRLAPIDWSEPTPGATISDKDDITGEPRTIKIGGRAYLFIKIIPDVFSHFWNKRDLKVIATEHQDLLSPIAAPCARLEIQRNQYGVAAWAVTGEQASGAVGSERRAGIWTETMAATQLKENGEFWSADAWLLANWHYPQKPGYGIRLIPLLPMKETEEAFERALPRFAAFALHHLQQKQPARAMFGINGIAGHRLALAAGTGDLGPMAGDGAVFGDALLSDPLESVNWRALLVPFFQKIWLNFDRERPTDFRS